MRGASQNQPLLRLLHMVHSDRLGGRDREFLDDLVGQRVDQPRLPRGQLHRPIHRHRGENLPGLRRVLAVQLSHLGRGEIPQPQRLELDVERAGGAEPGRVTPGSGLIITHIPQPAQRHRGGKPLRTLVEPGPQLAQHADQTRTTQRVNLVEKQHQRPRADPRPPRERCLQQVRLGHLRPRRRSELRRQPDLGTASDLLEDAALRSAVVVAGSLANLAREMQRRVHAASGQLLRQRPQRGRLPRLPRGVHHEIAQLGDQIGRLRQPSQRRNHVMVRRQTRPRRVEPASHELEPSATSDDDRPRHSTVHHVPHRALCVPRRVPRQALRSASNSDSRRCSSARDTQGLTGAYPGLD